MAIVHDGWDMELVATATCSADASTAVVSEKIIDTTETGGIEASTLWVTCPAATQALTLKVLGSDTEDGNFTTEVLTYTTTANAEFKKFDRHPLHAPRFLKLSVTTGETAPTTAVTAMLRFAV